MSRECHCVVTDDRNQPTETCHWVLLKSSEGNYPSMMSATFSMFSACWEIPLSCLLHLQTHKMFHIETIRIRSWISHCSSHYRPRGNLFGSVCLVFVWMYREHPWLLTNTEILNCIPCVMVILPHLASQALISTNAPHKGILGRTDRHTDGHHQTYYLPAVLSIMI